MLEFIKRLYNLRDGEEDKTKTLENVKANISFRGAALWILACAILIASVGLNVNSTAVVIGAMLISPLMGPIVGAGFALGINDFNLLKRSLKNLLIATIVSLFVSTVFFFLSPFKEASSEILARTSPNIYDVLIAFFGGVVGAVAITRIEKGNPIPGVAIATALMPPLCTAGFGLATGDLRCFFGAIYLYTINCVFICIATFVIVKYLQYPSITFVDEKRKKFITRLVSIIVVLMIVPSSFFAYNLYREQQFRLASEKFITEEFTNKGNTLVYKKINYSPQKKSIELAFLQKNYDSTEIKSLEKIMTKFGLSNTQLIIRPNVNQNFEKFKDDLLNEVSSKDKEMAELKTSLQNSQFDNKQLMAELNIFFPEIQEAAFEKIDFATKDSIVDNYGLLIRVEKPFDSTRTMQLKTFAERKFNIPNVQVIQFE